MRTKVVCFNCGYRSLFNENKCPSCGNVLDKISILDAIKLDKLSGEQSILKWIENKSGHPISEDGLLLHKKYIEKRKQERVKKEEAYQAKLKAEQEAKLRQMTQKALDKVNNIPKCPICGSTNINKITLTTRAVKTATFGVVGAVDDAGKTYKCGNCGSRF